MNSPAPSLLRRLVLCLVCLATGASGVILVGPASASNKVTPGNFTGYGFDQCVAPTQRTMDTWLTSSPYWAVGIYISGDSRGCPTQPNLTPGWISQQLSNGWRLLPLTVGPQASCSARDRYQGEVRISASSTHDFAQARQQGHNEAAKSVNAAQRLGISTGSTLWYDIEGFDISATQCRESAISFLSAWTNKLHTLGYVSGIYSSASSGIKMLDDANAYSPGRYAIPDQVWIADWNGIADVESSYVRYSSWRPHKRVHQYQGGHDETYGGVTINVDSNFMSLGRGSAAPKPRKTCGVRVDFGSYHRLAQGADGTEVKALQCLLTHKGTFGGGITGAFNRATHRALVAYQTEHRIKATGVTTLRTWTAILAEGIGPVLKFGSVGNGVRRVQRALNAAVDARLSVTGVFDSSSTAAVERYQRVRGMPANGVVATDTWAQLEAGRR